MKNEKVSVNFTSVELGQMDFLVERGLYSNRSDFIRESVKRLLDKYESDFKQFAEIPAQTDDDAQPKIKTIGGIGIIKMKKDELLQAKRCFMKVKVKVIGAIVVPDDVTPELISESVCSVEVYGTIFASDEAKSTLAQKR